MLLLLLYYYNIINIISLPFLAGYFLFLAWQFRIIFQTSSKASIDPVVLMAHRLSLFDSVLCVMPLESGDSEGSSLL